MSTQTLSLIECAPGNSVVIAGTGFGTSGTASLGNQLIVSGTGLPPVYTGTVTLPSAFTDTAVTVQIPDGVSSGTLTIYASDFSQSTSQMRVVSQYAQASEYIGEGVDISGLATGELDAILRRASSYVDAYTSAGPRNAPGFRILQTVEQHKFHARPDRAPRFWPWRSPIVTMDALVFITSNLIRTSFNTSLAVADIYSNKDLGYSEPLAYAFGNYVLLGALETIGYTAGVVEIGYTSGYTLLNYPAGIRAATIMIATEILSYRNIQAAGFGGLSRVKTGGIQYDRRNESFAIPEPAKELLRPYISRRMA